MLPAECFITKSNFGVDTVYNVCVGTINSIPWGHSDYFLVAVGGLSSISLLFALGYAIIFKVKGY